MNQQPSSNSQSETHGRTFTHQSSTTKIVNIKTRKQAIWIKSIGRQTARSPSSKLVEKQIVACHGTMNNPPLPEEILAIYPKDQSLNMIELNRKHGTMNPETGRMMDPVVFWRREKEDGHTTQVSSQDEKTAEAFRKPASADCIMAHLLRMSTFLTLKGTSKDAPEGDPQTLFILSDYTDRLLDRKTRETDLFLACDHFIETEADGFFPTVARLLKQVEKEASA